MQPTLLKYCTTLLKFSYLLRRAMFNLAYIAILSP